MELRGGRLVPLVGVVFGGLSFDLAPVIRAQRCTTKAAGRNDIVQGPPLYGVRGVGSNAGGVEDLLDDIWGGAVHDGGGGVELCLEKRWY